MSEGGTEPRRKYIIIYFFYKIINYNSPARPVGRTPKE